MIKIPNNVKATVFCSAAAISAAFIPSEEGMRTEAYLDIVGIPTICMGDTEGVKLGQTTTVDDCNVRLNKRTEKLIPMVEKTVRIQLAGATIASLTAFCDNVGTKACMGSESFKAMRIGHIREGCDKLLNWSRAGKNRYALLGRRMRERALCLVGDDIQNGRAVDWRQYETVPVWFAKGMKK